MATSKMKKNLSIFIGSLVIGLVAGKGEKGYTPDWDSLDSRPLPSWFDKAKIGIFLHWGVFSVPAYGSEWFWYNLEQNNGNNSFHDFVRSNYSENWKYQDFASQFRAELFQPDEWAKLFRKSGARYVVLTSKHHEGFTMWPSKYSWNWNAGDIGPKRDLLGDLATAVRKEKLTFGLYHSLYEWFNPNYLFDKANNFSTKSFVKEKTMPELYELVEKYQPSVIWSDGEWEASEDYWESKEFLAWLYNESPIKDQVVVNDRWGQGTNCKHGGFLSCADRYSPGVLQKRKWENAMTLDKSTWGFSRLSNVESYYTTTELIHELVKTVSCGGNLLVNVGPRADGTIPAIFQDRLLGLGDWLNINGESIYNSKPFKMQNDTITPDVWYTNNQNIVYAIFSNWPANDSIELSINKHIRLDKYQVLLLNNQGGNHLKFQTTDESVFITLQKIDLLYSIKPWVLRFWPERV